MKRRSRLRSRSLKNSRPGIDIKLRAAYMAREKSCEFCSAKPVDPHHICGGSPKVDNWSNLISTCRRHHDWCHDNPIIGKLRCWEVKLRKGELNEAEVDRALRMRVRGWLDSDKVKLACELAGERWELVRMHLAEILDFRREDDNEEAEREADD